MAFPQGFSTVSLSKCHWGNRQASGKQTFYMSIFGGSLFGPVRSILPWWILDFLFQYCQVDRLARHPPSTGQPRRMSLQECFPPCAAMAAPGHHAGFVADDKQGGFPRCPVGCIARFNRRVNRKKTVPVLPAISLFTQRLSRLLPKFSGSVRSPGS